MSFSFGQPAPAAPAPSGGLFGSQPAQPASSSTFGGFGAAAPKPAFSFGSPAPAAPQPQTSLFGSTSTTPAPSTSLFGQPQQQQQAPSTSLFGAPPAQPGLFGQQPQQPPQQQGGLFGSTSQQQPQQQQQQSTFGFQSQNQPQQQQQQQQQPPLGMSQLGASSFGGAAPGGGPVKLEDLSIEQRMEYVKGAWDPSSPTCKFQYFFYNLVPPNETHLYGRPQNARDDAAWFKAQRENPDPSTMVPALAIGFDDIRKRTDAQMKMAGAHWNKLQEISTRLSTLSQSSSLSLTLRLSRASLLQTQLSHRTLLLIRHLHLLIPTLRSSSIRREEEQLLLRLEALMSELQGGAGGGFGGGGGGSVKGRMMELWALVGQVRGERERDRLAGGRGEGAGAGGGEGGGKEGWAVVDEEAMERLAAIISDQQTALAHLTKVLKEDLAAIEIMRQGLGLSASKEQQQQS
ncbi:nucleoporin complex subunit 54-domain-containing protein [Mrakia frigida]|uniref:nucleoporin complex subunit 54-domain-containing protein n=1 Tax=Mrakia frigida TaxID=29902 RepID=UPI003FCC0276